MPTGKPNPRKFSEENGIKIWVLNEEGKSGVELGKMFGVHCSTIYAWLKKINTDPELLAKAKEAHSSKENKPSIEDTPVVSGSYHSIRSLVKESNRNSQLADENAFLRWWCTGERAGWVDRLLAELKKMK